MDLLQGISIDHFAEILNRLDDPLFLIDRQRLILYRNAASARALEGTAVTLQSGRLLFSASDDDSKLEKILEERSASPAKGRPSRGLRFTDLGALARWLVVVSLIEAESRQVTSMAEQLPVKFGVPTGALFLIHFVDPLRSRPLPGAALQDLFDLNLKEVDALEGLSRNESLRDVAQRMQLSHETIRAYMKRIFRKCEVRSRIELLVLLHRLALLSQDE